MASITHVPALGPKDTVEPTIEHTVLAIAALVLGLIGLLTFGLFGVGAMIGLVLGGIAILFLDGVTKNSIVAGPILIASGIAWALHDRWHVTWFVLLPTLLVLLGVLMLIARRANIPERRVRQT